MAIRILETVRKTGIIEGVHDMSATGVQFGSLRLTGDPVNAMDLAGKMGLPLDTLSRAVRAESADLAANPRLNQWQPSLREVANLWGDLTAMFGGEENARQFMRRKRPELMDETPLHYLERGEPEIVQNLVHAMREMLP
jgi:uncharacterized protein (DUF2384 family)